MNERKFKIGDVVKPIKLDPNSHNFEEWKILTITRVSDSNPNLFECTRESDGTYNLLWDFELELVEEDKVEEVQRELRVGDRVVMTKLDSEPFTFDKVGNTGKVIWTDPFLIGIKVDGVDLPSCSYYRKEMVWEPLEEIEDKTYSHEEVAEILGISENEVETVSVDITPKEYDRFEWNKPDMVNHPKHYTKGGIETLDFILAKVEGLTPQEAVLVGHIIRYVSRYNDKFDPVEDLKKAKFYLEKLIELREELE